MNIDKGIASSGTELVTFSEQEYTKVSKLSTKEKRILTRRMVKAVPLSNMTYEQAKLYHRLRGRIT